MSQENVEVVSRMWGAFLAGDFDTTLSCLAWQSDRPPLSPIG